jgi:anti-anti-sigma factor
MSLYTVTTIQGRVPVTVLHILDRLNLGNIPELEKKTSELIAAGVQDLVIDLSKTPSLTSAALRLLVSLHKQLKQPGSAASHLKLVSPTPYVRETLQIAGLLDYIEVFEDLNSAAATF